MNRIKDATVIKTKDELINEKKMNTIIVIKNTKFGFEIIIHNIPNKNELTLIKLNKFILYINIKWIYCYMTMVYLI